MPYEGSKVMIGEEDDGYLLGIDEAGRGPVLGPMVYGLCYCPVSKKEALSKTGFADSKVLKDSERRSLFDTIKNSPYLGWKVDIIHADYISQQMLRRTKVSLNAIAHTSTINLIEAVIQEGVNITEIYVDTVGPPESYQAKLQRHFPRAKCVVRKKADSLFPIVSAASICAKVTRDILTEGWKFPEAKNGVSFTNEYGSGYPGDPNCQLWLPKHVDPVFGFPDLVRFSWSTAKKIMIEKCMTVEWDDDEEEEGKEHTQSMSNFLEVSKHSRDSRVALKDRNMYFKRRKMHVACDFDPIEEKNRG